VAYHDREWGVPLHDDHRLFEMLILEGAQAGLSWITILRKREGYRAAFDEFVAARVARYGARDIVRLLRDAGIVRNRLKIEAAVSNARAYLRVVEREGSFDHYLWALAGGCVTHNAWRTVSEVPARTLASDRVSRQLRADGFRFVGSTICYAFMQAVGMVNDHTIDCFRYRQLQARRARRPPAQRTSRDA
jgi:DNA-3-methyladenine glycosylase I